VAGQVIQDARRAPVVGLWSRAATAAFDPRRARPQRGMTDDAHDEQPDDDTDKHPLTQVKNPLADDDEKSADGEDDAWVPPVP
jgi:hypothetical protein